MDNFDHTSKDDQLIVRSFVSELSEEELGELQLRLREDIQFKKHYEEMKTLWYFSAMSKKDKEQDWKNIKSQFTSTSSISLWGYVVRIAAIFVLFLSVSTGLWLYWNVPGYGRWEVFNTNGSSDSIVLPDQSIVFLNKNSSLKYPKTFSSDKRVVSLTGEGYFEVKHNDLAPFNVNVADLTVKVLGTAFNLYENKNSGKVKLSVVDGSVLLINKNRSEVVSKGESTLADRYTLQKGMISDMNFLSWKTGILEYNNASLTEILNSLVYHYDEISSFENLSDCEILVTTKFDSASIDEIFEELEIHFQKNFSLNNGKLIITD